MSIGRAMTITTTIRLSSALERWVALAPRLPIMAPAPHPGVTGSSSHVVWQSPALAVRRPYSVFPLPVATGEPRKRRT